MKFVLIGNYSLDKQESMKRYTDTLAENLHGYGAETEIWLPVIFFAFGQKSTEGGLGKWIGYIDKWILFPFIILMRRLLQRKYSKKDIFFHVCDHSNAPYLKYLPSKRSGITCHDVLAIRGAFGHQDAYCPATPAGVVLQKWILGNLKKANVLTAVSQFTMNQLLELCNYKKSDKPNWEVIYNSFNADFYPMDKAESNSIITALGVPAGASYILHVGSSLQRKNREMLLKMIHAAGSGWSGYVCFAGHAIDNDLKELAVKLGVNDRIIEIIRPEHKELVVLYSACTAFVFPSFSEGFGWPLIEAQACGAPVIASNIAPMPEIANGTALMADPYSADDFARALIQLLNETTRNAIIQSGFENCKRFETKALIKKFVQLYTNAG